MFEGVSFAVLVYWRSENGALPPNESSLVNPGSPATNIIRDVAPLFPFIRLLLVI